MKKETVLIVVVALLIALTCGCLVFSIREGSGVVSSGGGVAYGADPPGDFRQRIAKGEKAVAREPKDLAAWIQLGNDYFDADQPALAVNAYEKALELDPDNLEVLVDQGNCCRKIGWYDKAAENFEKALKIDPNHEPSLVNLGILYAVDLRQPDKALKAWNRFLELNPTCAAARQVRRWVEDLKADPESFAGKK